MDISLDQVRVMLAVVEHGSFSGAGRALNRAQSAVTYAVQSLEDSLGVVLFDRTGYRPALTEAGRVLLAGARRLAEEAGAFQVQARGIAGGLEPELTLVVDALFPLPPLLEALRAFNRHYPETPTRLYVEPLRVAVGLVLDGTCALGLLPVFTAEADTLAWLPLLDVELVPVAAPCHPLAALPGPIPPEEVRRHVQLVLTERSAGISGPDRGVLATRTWRLGDLSAKHAMLLAGLGWGNMPRHMVAEDLRQGRLHVLQPTEFVGKQLRLGMCVAHRTDGPLGPATQWMLEHLAAVSKAGA